jgi:hypothetical protein
VSAPTDAIEEALEWAGLEDGQAAEWAPTVVGCLRAHRFVIVPADPTPDAVGAWWHCKNNGGSDYDAYRALVAVASGEKRPEDLWKSQDAI